VKHKPFHFWVLVDKEFGDIESMVSPWDMQMKLRPQAYFTRQEARIASKIYRGAYRVTKVEVK
jgi:hypothetical protein